MNFGTLPSYSYYKKFSIKDLLDVVKVKHTRGGNGKKTESRSSELLELWLLFKYIPGSMGPCYLLFCLQLEMLVTSFLIGFNDPSGPRAFREVTKEK